jgi:hypothetical protein
VASPKKKMKTDWVEKMKADAKAPKKASTPKGSVSSGYSPSEWKSEVNRTGVPGKDYGVGKNPGAPRFKSPSPAPGRFSQAAEKAAQIRKVGGYAANAGNVATKTAKTAFKLGSKVLGAAAIPLDMISSAKPAGEGSDKPSGPLMKGNAKKASPMKTSLPKPTKAAKPNPNLGYGTFNAPAKMPKATGSESVGPSAKPKTSYPAPSAPTKKAAPVPSAPQSSVSPNVGTSTMQGESKQRGGVRTLQTRYQRDNALAMETRKRK